MTIKLIASRKQCINHLSDGKEFHCHRIILAATSDMFKGMLSSGMKESEKNKIKFPYSSESINIMLDFIYDPAKTLLEMSDLSLTLYAELLEISEAYEFDKIKESLKNKKVVIDKEEILSAIYFSTLYKDTKLINQVFRILKDREYIEEELRDLIRAEVFSEESFLIEKLLPFRRHNLSNLLFSKEEQENLNLSFPQKVENVLAMRISSKEELEMVIDNENYYKLESFLIKNLEKTISNALPLTTSREFLSFYFGHYMIYISTAYNATSNAAGNAAGVALLEALLKLEIENPQSLGNAAWRLSNLYVLAFISNPSNKTND